ncbi:hypothetical protein Rsub_08181 [Raphidocelis subcapitata]|uniref:Neurotransmitter-gated ion-channel ligand-binding domain-containing protein n=1 Tax=Raphidocelis subcapitata TaxID=307507 RepID=A0A2V0PF87_9CHLO|nr:hypothetical protein Rsub_08181 [Raphidocelis subcapitata]|eukprot:GBF95745.1 hypothetical protein Rsub_08181 [Raphidocelis subcapitata]
MARPAARPMLFKSVLLALAGAVVAAGAAGGEARAAAAAGGSAADDAVLVIVAQRPGTLEPSALRGALQLNGSLPAVREHVVAFAAAELGVGAECIAAVHEWEHAWGDWGAPLAPGGGPMGPKPRRQLDNELYNKLMEGYQRDVVPPSVGPIPVGISITFYQINAVDLYSGRLSISVWFSLYWKDSRLTWDPKEYNGTSTIFFGNPQQGDVGVWIPDVVVWNSAQAMTTTLGMQAVRASFDGSMFWSRDGTIEVTCTFTGLQAYPYGTYTCDAEFGSWNFGMASMMLHPEGAGAVIEVAKTSVALGGYTFREYTLTNVTVREQRYDEFVGWEGEGEWNNVIYTVRFMRASDIYSLKILVPQVMLTLISFSTMW